MVKDKTREIDEPLEHAGLLDLFFAFLKIGVTSFGGASRPMMHRESVEKHRWLHEKDFLAGFAIAQVLPGANPVNLALYIGLRVRGVLGAAIAVLGMVVPAFCLILAIGFVYRQLTGYPATHMVLAGLAAAGVAATLSTGIKMTFRLDRNLLTVLIMLALTPVTVKSTKSMLAMQRLQPEMKTLQAKYKGAENRELLNQRLD